MRKFSKQLSICKDNRNLIKIKNIDGEFPPTINVCITHRIVCQSKVCRKIRRYQK